MHEFKRLGLSQEDIYSVTSGVPLLEYFNSYFTPCCQLEGFTGNSWLGGLEVAVILGFSIFLLYEFAGTGVLI